MKIQSRALGKASPHKRKLQGPSAAALRPRPKRAGEGGRQSAAKLNLLRKLWIATSEVAALQLELERQIEAPSAGGKQEKPGGIPLCRWHESAEGVELLNDFALTHLGECDIDKRIRVYHGLMGTLPDASSREMARKLAIGTSKVSALELELQLKTGRLSRSTPREDLKTYMRQTIKALPDSIRLRKVSLERLIGLLPRGFEDTPRLMRMLEAIHCHERDRTLIANCGNN